MEEGCAAAISTTNNNNIRDWEVSSSSLSSSDHTTTNTAATSTSTGANDSISRAVEQIVHRRGGGSKQHSPSPTRSIDDSNSDKLPLLANMSGSNTDSSSCAEMEPISSQDNNNHNNNAMHVHKKTLKCWTWLLFLSFVVSQCIYHSPGIFLEVAYFPARGRTLPNGLQDLILKPTFHYEAVQAATQDAAKNNIDDHTDPQIARTVASAETAEENAVHIPRIVHVTYKSREELPDEWRYSLHQWEATNPTWEVRFWSDADIATFVEKEYPHVKPLHDSYKYMIQRVDSVRYMILHHFGGVYSDMDIYPSTTLDKLLIQWEEAGKEVLLAETFNLGVTNAFMAAAPNTDFMGCLIDNLPHYQHKFHHIIGWQHWEVLSSAGSTYLWGMVGHCQDDDKVAILNRRAFRGCSVCDAWETGKPSAPCDTEWFHHSSINSSWHQHKSFVHAFWFNVAMAFNCRPFHSCFMVSFMGLALIFRCRRHGQKQLGKG